MEQKKVAYPVCGKQGIDSQVCYDPTYVFYDCPICGRYQFFMESNNISEHLDKNKLGAYLYYNSFKNTKNGGIERRYHTTLDKEKCDQYGEEYNSGNNTHGRPVYMDEAVVDSWYPKSFSEKVDKILMKLYSLSEYIGADISLDVYSLHSCTFVERFEGKQVRAEEQLINQAHYMMNCLQEMGYITGKIIMHGTLASEGASFGPIKLTPKGYERIDVLQKNGRYGNDAFVAMQFGEKTIKLREAIRQGIMDAGYGVVFIDEVEHNELITPEILAHIKNSKFVVVDLTNNNSGAYFEEGYAMGLGKTVIQLCRKGEKLHFDIAQKNTIMWEEESDIPLKLCNRIKATID